MGAPTPPLDITGHCSATFNNTLYIFSPSGFQSIPLSNGGQWKVLEPGVSVEGGKCVKTSGSDASTSALWIVGGRANSTQSQFSGLQKYTYATGKWETIVASVPVSQNRQAHGATFLKQSSAILTYAGSQDPGNNNPSSQTFLISTSPPYNVLSYVSTAPPLINPIVMPWNDSHAVMIGGDNQNKGVYLFGPDGWSNLGTTLTNPIASDNSQQATTMTGDDGSKVLELYDMATSPNTISQIVLFSNGQPAPPGTMVGNAPPRRFRRRDLTAASWPAYNASGAPTGPRTGFALASSQAGFAVISGGGPASDPLLFFNQRTNAWVQPSAVFGSQTILTTPSSTPSSIPSSAPTSSPTPTPTTAPADSSSKSHTLTVLGGALGGILGFAALLILILLLIKWSADRSRRRAEEQAAREKDDRLSFFDKGTTSYHQDAEAQGYPNVYQHKNAQFNNYGPQTNSMVGSISSLQIFGGKSGNGNGNGHRRAQNSDSSTAGLVQNLGPGGEGADDLEMAQVPGTYERGIQVSRPGTAGTLEHQRNISRDGPLDRSTAGWSDYFNGNTGVTNLASPTSTTPQPRNDMLAPSYMLAPGIPIQSVRTSTATASSDYNGASKESTPRIGTSGMAPLPPQPTSDGPAAGSHYRVKMLQRGASTASYDRRHWSLLSEDRESDTSSIMTAFPTVGNPPSGNAFASGGNPLKNGPARSSSPLMPIPGSLVATPQSRDFPMPQGYFQPKSPQDSAREEAMLEERKGLKLKKLTGSEDMSWLNLNAPGRAL